MSLKSVKTYFLSTKISKAHKLYLIITTLLMYLTGGFFSAKKHLNHPQFSEISTKNWFKNLDNVDSYNQLLYKLFFVLDYIWAPALLFAIYKFVKRKINEKQKLKWLPYVLLIISTAALILDYIENYLYLTTYEYPLIAEYKTPLYGIVFITFLFIALWDVNRRTTTTVIDFLKSSWVSLLILFVFGLTLPKVPQFNSIIVDLYYSYFQFPLIFLGVFVPIAIVTLSHYPNYFLLRSGNKTKARNKHWKLSDRFWFFGTVWYVNKSSSSNAQKRYDYTIGFLRKIIGILFLAAVFQLLANTADTNFDVVIKFSKLTVPFTLGMVYLLYYHSKKYAKWTIVNTPYLKETLDSMNSSKSVRQDPSLYSISKYPKYYLIWLLITIVLLIAFSLKLRFSNDSAYNMVNVIISLICIVCQGITYVYYRIYRSAFKYSFFNPKHDLIYYGFNLLQKNHLTKNDIEKRKLHIQHFFNTHDFKQGDWMLQTFSKLKLFIFSLGAFSYNVIFLKKIIYVGFLNVAFLIVFNIYDEYAINVNPVLIILSYFLLFYGVVVILIKHSIYYFNSTEKYAIENKGRYFKVIVASVLSLIILNFLARFNNSTKNNLYKLSQLTRIEDDEVSLTEYAKNLKTTNQFYVGCYGGGMKANAWSMTVLNKLDETYDFMSKATCISGASGGTMGLINYTSIFNNISKNERKQAIENIATENILSVDLIHFLGRDLFTHLFMPSVVDLRGRDRSTAAMKIYAKYGGYKHGIYKSRLFDTLAYRNYWTDVYNTNNKQFPILIANSTNIKGKQAMAVSVKTTNKKVKDAIYYGADDILEINYLTKKRTLSYYNAASTSNRFPLLSPAATIEGKGQYTDGGIFDNSGLLSAFKIYKALKMVAPDKTKKNIFVNIINSKDLFIKSYLEPIFNKNTSCFYPDINEVSEIPAIINSVSSTEMVPDHIKSRIEFLTHYDKQDSLTFVNIHLPHSFDLEDVKRIYKPKIRDLTCVNDLLSVIKRNDSIIDNLNKEISTSQKFRPVIEPELSRVIAKPAFDFMQIMLKHPFVASEIQQLECFLSEN